MSAFDPKRTWLRICPNTFAPRNKPGSPESRAKSYGRNVNQANISTAELQGNFLSIPRQISITAWQNFAVQAAAVLIVENGTSSPTTAPSVGVAEGTSSLF